jgi:hypothetical protein
MKLERKEKRSAVVELGAVYVDGLLCIKTIPSGVSVYVCTMSF